MKLKTQRSVIIILILSVLIIMTGYFAYRHLSVLRADKSWITDLGYEESEISEMTFDRYGERSCPEIPVSVGNNTFQLGFDTGCGSGIFFTDVIEEKIDYTLLHRAEALNRDGSHRGWENRVQVNEISVFGDTYNNIETSISDWSMFSSKKFNGTIGLAYFKDKVVTLDYEGHRIGVKSHPIDYTKLDSDRYVVLPLYKTTTEGQRDLPFFEAEYNGVPVMIYMDTGKNYSFLFNPDSDQKIGDKPSRFFDIPLKIGDMELVLRDISEVGNFAQVEGLPYPTMIELNSDQIWKCNLLVTFDLIEQKIIFRKGGES